MDVQAAGLESRVVEDFLVQRHVGLDALDYHFRQRISHARHRRGAILAMGNDFADERIVIRRHGVTGINMAVDPDARTAGRMPQPDGAGGRDKALGVLGVDAAFDGVAADLHVLLPDIELLARRDQQLRLDDVDAGDHLGHRMLDLHARVHFDEIKLPVLVQEFQRAGAAIADRRAGDGAALAHHEVLGQHPALVSLAKLRLQAVDDYPSSSTGLLFVAHGTPIEEANQPVAAVLAGVQQQLGYGPASIGYLDCNQPAILDAFDQLAAAGVNRIAVLPYFLHLGRHVRRDLPALFAEAIARHPSLDIRIAHHLADDPLLVDVVATRIVAAQCAIARHVCVKAGITVRKELQ